MKNKLLLTAVIILSFVVAYQFIKPKEGFEDLAGMDCYDPNSMDKGFFVEFEREKEQAQFGSINFAGRQTIAEYTCERQLPQDVPSKVKLSCQNRQTVDEGYVINFQEKTNDISEDQVAEVSVMKIRFSGMEKVARLPCFYKSK